MQLDDTSHPQERSSGDSNQGHHPCDSISQLPVYWANSLALHTWDTQCSWPAGRGMWYLPSPSIHTHTWGWLFKVSTNTLHAGLNYSPSDSSIFDYLLKMRHFCDVKKRTKFSFLWPTYFASNQSLKIHEAEQREMWKAELLFFLFVLIYK